MSIESTSFSNLAYNLFHPWIDKFTKVDKRNQQYDAISLADSLEPLKNGEDVHIIGFTSYDLFPKNSPDFNFIFGYGNYKGGHGVWSKARLGSQNLAVLLHRMMQLPAHEYGHMRLLSHCTDSACLMNGGMSVSEMDSTPLLLCSQDAAKVCWMSGLTMQEYYTNLLEFFVQFNSTYTTHVDFGTEISQIQKKLKLLGEKHV